MAPYALAHEPDGRTILRSEWSEATAHSSARPLRILISAVVSLTDARVRLVAPDAVAVRLRAVNRPGVSDSAGERAWSTEGLAVGDLGAGDTLVLELDVSAPDPSGGTLSLSLEATAGGRKFREGMGVVVGAPGTAPTVRNGAAEFPARRGGLAR